MLFTEADLISPGETKSAPAAAPLDLAAAVQQADIDMGFSESDLFVAPDKREDGRKKVLIVDDDPDIVEILKVRIEGGGYDCATASNGPEALGLVEQSRPDMAIVDILMPGMDGYEVCRQMKILAGERAFPIILISEKTDTDSVVRALDLGAADFVRKPVDTQELLVRMRTVLQLREDLRKAREQIKELTHINSTLVRSNAKLSTETTQDELTNLLNRGHFLERLHQHVELARAAKTPLAIALFRFKTLAGGALTDQGLPSAAKQLLEVLRPIDIASRIEPVMFCVLMPATAPKEAKSLSDKWRRVLGQEFGNVKSVDHVTDALKDGESPLDFLDRLEYGEWLE